MFSEGPLLFRRWGWLVAEDEGENFSCRVWRTGWGRSPALRKKAAFGRLRRRRRRRRGKKGSSERPLVLPAGMPPVSGGRARKGEAKSGVAKPAPLPLRLGNPDGGGRLSTEAAREQCAGSQRGIRLPGARSTLPPVSLGRGEGTGAWRKGKERLQVCSGSTAGASA